MMALFITTMEYACREKSGRVRCHSSFTAASVNISNCLRTPSYSFFFRVGVDHMSSSEEIPLNKTAML